MAAALVLAGGTAAAQEGMAPWVGVFKYRAMRLGESGASQLWKFSEEAATRSGLRDYTYNGTVYCSITLVSDTGWVNPVYFANTTIEMSNTKRQGYEFVSPPCNGLFHNVDGLFHARERLVGCPEKWVWDSTIKLCVQPTVDPNKNNDHCPQGNNGSNPVHTALGTKLQREIDIAVPGSELRFERYYSSTTSWRAGNLGKQWRHNFERHVDFSETPTRATAYVSRPNGNVYVFNRQLDGSFLGDADVTERLHEGVIDENGTVPGWTLINPDDSEELYDVQGLLTSIRWPDGRRLDFFYDDGLLTVVQDERGRQLSITYHEDYPTLPGSVLGLIDTVTAPDGRVTRFDYQAAGSEHVISRRTTDGRGQRDYVYGEGGVAPRLLTGIVDENGIRYASWRYDSQSRAILSVHGDASSYADRVEFTYSGDAAVNPSTATTTVKEWIDGSSTQYTERTYSFALRHGVVKLAGVTQPCASCGGKVQTTTFDTNGFDDTLTDFNGVVTDRDFAAMDAAGRPRGLETLRVDAASKGTQTNLPERRSTTTTWHATFHKPLQRSVSNRDGVVESLQQWTYNTRGQPTAHCRFDTTQAGYSSYACSASTAPPAGLNVRRTLYTYCEAADVAVPSQNCPVVGYLKSVNGPRSTTDAGTNGLDDVTQYLYRFSKAPNCTATSCAYRKGDLWRVIDALGHVTEYVEYHGDGRVKLVKDANGTYTGFTYGANGWLSTRTVYAGANPVPSAGDAVTTYEYLPTGEVYRVTEPDGSYLQYTYDGARRLTGISDKLGNRVVYTLDSIGHRIGEQTFDASYDPSVPGQGLKRSIARAYNDLGRLTSVLNAAQAPTRDSTGFDGNGLLDGYDANGNAVLSADGLGISKRQDFDALNRLVAVLNDYDGPDSQTSNAQMSYTYDTRNNVRTATDPDGLTTTYTYDGLDNLVALDSPDTGHTAYTYDRAGNRLTSTDNRGTTASYTFDALNRITAINYGGGENATFTYDQFTSNPECSGDNPVGRVSGVTDSSGTTSYCYDRRGNVLHKTQVAGGVSLSVAYTYTTADKLASIVYPGGGVATYGRDDMGRITSLNWLAPGASNPVAVLSAATYLPFGPLTSLTYGNGRTLTKEYDADYVIDGISSSAPDGLQLDFTTDVMGNIVAAKDSFGLGPPKRLYVYDRLYRINSLNDGADQPIESYAYTKNGDRTLKQLAGQSPQVYSYLSGTHRLAAIDAVSRSYDSNGNTTARGDGKTLTYDARNRYVTLSTGKVPTLLANYRYNGLGERVTKELPGVSTTTFLFDESGRLLYEVSAAGATSYLYLDAMPVALSGPAGLSFIETDHLDTPRVVANGSNMSQWFWNFFGSPFGEQAAVGLGSVPVNLPLRYPGQYFDAESGLNYNVSRDYEPATGRYIESDPLGLHGDWNTYAYVDGDPLSATDPLGLKSNSGEKLCKTIFPVDGVKCDGSCNCQMKYDQKACICNAKSRYNPVAIFKSYICVERAREDARMCIWNCSGVCPCETR